MKKVFDKTTGKWLSSIEINQLLADTSIPLVPNLQRLQYISNEFVDLESKKHFNAKEL